MVGYTYSLPCYFGLIRLIRHRKCSRQGWTTTTTTTAAAAAAAITAATTTTAGLSSTWCPSPSGQSFDAGGGEPAAARRHPVKIRKFRSSFSTGRAVRTGTTTRSAGSIRSGRARTTSGEACATGSRFMTPATGGLLG